MSGRSVQLTLRCAHPTRIATRSSNCCAPPSPTKSKLDPAEFDQRLDAALAARTIDGRWPRSPPI